MLPPVSPCTRKQCCQIGLVLSKYLSFIVFVGVSCFWLERNLTTHPVTNQLCFLAGFWTPFPRQRWNTFVKRPKA